MALPASRALPPPIATTTSQPASRANAAPSRMRATEGSPGDGEWDCFHPEGVALQGSGHQHRAAAHGTGRRRSFTQHSFAEQNARRGGESELHGRHHSASGGSMLV